MFPQSCGLDDLAVKRSVCPLRRSFGRIAHRPGQFEQFFTNFPSNVRSTCCKQRWQSVMLPGWERHPPEERMTQAPTTRGRRTVRPPASVRSRRDPGGVWHGRLHRHWRRKLNAATHENVKRKLFATCDSSANFVPLYAHGPYRADSGEREGPGRRSTK